MLLKLQRKTLVLPQLIGYALTIFIGISIILTVSQFYTDVKPLISEQTDTFSKSCSHQQENFSFQVDEQRENILTDKDIAHLKKQSFVKRISRFNTATFEISAFTKKGEDIPAFYTDLFFESIPDDYLDVQAQDWKWDQTEKFIPIIIPENYLNLYNFGFAESQGLPVLSKTTISDLTFSIKLRGNGKYDIYKSKIVGFSSKLNSILVPDDFLKWANTEFGQKNDQKSSRILVEFTDPSDESILTYFNENNYSINKEKLEFSKLAFFFKTAMLFVFVIALIIISLSIAFVLLSISLIIQRNKEMMKSLYYLGYNHQQIANFYRIVIGAITIICFTGAMIITATIRSMYLDKMKMLMEFDSPTSVLYVYGFGLLALLLIVYYFMISMKIKKVVSQ